MPNRNGETSVYRTIDLSEKDIYEIGDRIGQIMILPYLQVEFQESDNLSETSRGDGGFGSTGTH